VKARREAVDSAEGSQPITIYLTIQDDGKLLIQAFATNEEGDLADLVREIGPGQEFLGWTFEELKALGEGEHTIDERPAGSE